MFDHHLGLLGDVVGVQPHEAGQSLSRLLALDVGVVLARLHQLVIGGVGRVILQHIHDEALFNGLPHGVAVKGLAGLAHLIAPEHRQGLVLRGGRKGEETEIRLTPALGHTAVKLVQVFDTFVDGIVRRFLP